MESARPRVVAVLGVTGRLGPAVARALSGEVRGLSRRAALADEAVPAGVRIVRADRRDVDALASVIDGADAVVDLVGLSRDDADALLDAAARSKRPPRHLVFASSTAVHFANDLVGRAKREAQARYEAGFAGRVHTLVLPRLVAAVDPARREQPYLDAARATGRALVAGDGSQRQTVAPVEGVAAVIRALVDDPEALPAGAVNVGPREPVTVADAVRALVDGAGLGAPVGRHPDRAWRAPHGGADEVLDARALAEALPEITWPDALEVYRALGRWLAANPAPGRRPLPVVSPSKRLYAGRRTCDVHDRRAPHAPMHPALEALASWITPSFYVDLGRPCNAACVYCSVPPHGDTEGFAPVEALVDVVKAGVLAGCERAILIGGEPTIHPALTTVLSMLRDAGFSRGNVVMTNGLRLADERLVGALVEGGVGTLHVSVDTSDEAVYDRLSRSRGQFARQRRGLANALARRDVNVYVYAVATRWNAPSLADHIASLAGLARSVGRAPAPVVVAFAKPVGDALAHAGELMLPPEERALVARELVRAGDALGVPVGFRNLQPCLAPELLPRVVDACLEDRSVDLRTRAWEPYRHDAEYVRRVAACEGCAAKGFCPGAYRDDVARYGEAAYRGVTGIRLPGPGAAGTITA